MPVPAVNVIPHFNNKRVGCFVWADDDVRALRARFHASPTHDVVGEIADAYGTLRGTVLSMLTGRTHKHVGGAYPAAKIARRRLTDEEVVAYRRMFRDVWGQITFNAIARQMGMNPTTCRRVLTGSLYPNLPEALPKYEAIKRAFPPEVVLFMRLQYPLPGVSLYSLAKAYRTNKATVSNLLLGKTYGDVPGALPRLKPSGVQTKAIRNLAARRFTPATVKALRESYDPKTRTVAQIAKEYGVTQRSVSDLLLGRTYKDIPGALVWLRKPGGQAQPLADDVVIEARASLVSLRETEAQIAKRLGRPIPSVRDMLKGKTYKHLPVPVTVRPRIIPVPKVRLIDHDERVDHVALRKAA